MNDKKAILIVDDEAILLMSLRQELYLRFGAEILYETATSAEKGLEVIGELRGKDVSVVLVISDWQMPGMRGDDFLKEVHVQYPNIRLIMLSGHADARVMDEIFQGNELFTFLSKPYRRQELYNLVSKALPGYGLGVAFP